MKIYPYEFCKLDSIDLKVSHWLFRNCPDRLYSYLEFIANNDYRRKGILVDARRIYDELLDVHKNETVVLCCNGIIRYNEIHYQKLI